MTDQLYQVWTVQWGPRHDGREGYHIAAFETAAQAEEFIKTLDGDIGEIKEWGFSLKGTKPTAGRSLLRTICSHLLTCPTRLAKHRALRYNALHEKRQATQREKMSFPPTEIDGVVYGAGLPEDGLVIAWLSPESKDSVWRVCAHSAGYGDSFAKAQYWREPDEAALLERWSQWRGPMILNRRSLIGNIGLVFAAPAIVKASSLMRISPERVNAGYQAGRLLSESYSFADIIYQPTAAEIADYTTALVHFAGYEFPVTVRISG